MGRKDTIFGVKYQNILLSIKILNYKDIFVETPIYIRYVVLTIVIFIFMLSIELFYCTQPSSFHGYFFEYLPLFIPLKVFGIYLKRFKDFRKFWPCSFVDPLVKSTDNFWKIRGLIDRINESRRQIYSGVEKTAYESMSAIRFCNTPKVDLPHYSYIFRKPEPFGTEMNNVACSRLGAMLHLEIQKWKEAMKISKFQSVLGGTTVCMKRIAIAAKGCCQLTSNDTYFSDRWFSSVKTAEEMAAAGVDCCGPVKTSHKGFF